MVKYIDGSWLAECPICGQTITSPSKLDAQTTLKDHITSKHRGDAPPKLPPDNLVHHV